MKFLAKNEVSDWFASQSIPTDESGRPSIPSDYDLQIPSDAGQRVALVASLMANFRNESEVLVLFRDWGVWPSGERMHIFDRFRLSYGENRPLIQASGQLFKKSEYEDALSFVTLGVLFLWDCYVVSAKGSKLLFFSHDEIGWCTFDPEKVEPDAAANGGDAGVTR